MDGARYHSPTFLTLSKFSAHLLLTQVKNERHFQMTKGKNSGTYVQLFIRTRSMHWSLFMYMDLFSGPISVFIGFDTNEMTCRNMLTWWSYEHLFNLATLKTQSQVEKKEH